jgi:hypothetical protein
MVMVSPEELPSRDFNQLLGVKKFWDRIFVLGVDKAHLLPFSLVEYGSVLHDKSVIRPYHDG